MQVGLFTAYYSAGSHDLAIMFILSCILAAADKETADRYISTAVSVLCNEKISLSENDKELCRRMAAIAKSQGRSVDKLQSIIENSELKVIAEIKAEVTE